MVVYLHNNSISCECCSFVNLTIGIPFIIRVIARARHVYLRKCAQRQLIVSNVSRSLVNEYPSHISVA